MFTRNEKALILDALNGTILDERLQDGSFIDAFTGERLSPGLGGQIAHNVSDAIRLDGLDQKWSIDGPPLVAKLKGLDKEEGLRLARAVGAWWDRVGAGEQPDYDELRWE